MDYYNNILVIKEKLNKCCTHTHTHTQSERERTKEPAINGQLTEEEVGGV